jgi:hypothetical protein
MNNSYATEPFCQTARESARVSLPPPGLTPYWDINRAEASAIFSFPSLARAPIFSSCLHTRYLPAQFQFLRISYSLKASAEEKGPEFEGGAASQYSGTPRKKRLRMHQIMKIWRGNLNINF